MQVRDYITQLEAHLAEVHRQSQRLIERQGKLGSSMSDFGASMVALGKFESGTLAQKFTKLGERADTLSGACQVNKYCFACCKVVGCTNACATFRIILI